jgi:hypothetical protein
MELPTSKIKASRVNPKRLVIYSKPKVGKTTLFSGLENNLVLDLEEGSDFVDALKIKINTLEELYEAGKKIKEAGYPYKYLTVDTVTVLEDLVGKLAISLYRQTAMGKSFGMKVDPASGKMVSDPKASVLTLPQGGGYLYQRMAFFQVLDFIDTLAPNIILSGHLKEKMLDDKGEVVEAANIDLTGKLKTLICASASAVGYLYRKGNQNILSFVVNDSVNCGSRSEHLVDKEIVVSEKVDGKIITHWDKIYI